MHGSIPDSARSYFCPLLGMHMSCIVFSTFRLVRRIFLNVPGLVFSLDSEAISDRFGFIGAKLVRLSIGQRVEGVHTNCIEPEDKFVHIFAQVLFCAAR